MIVASFVTVHAPDMHAAEPVGGRGLVTIDGALECSHVATLCDTPCERCKAPLEGPYAMECVPTIRCAGYPPIASSTILYYHPACHPTARLHENDNNSECEGVRR